MLNVQGTTIRMTRGDTAKLTLYLDYKDGSPYEPTEGDEIRFAAKKTFDDSVEPLILINIPTDTLLLHIRPDDTKDLEYGNYVYDIQLTTATGDVDTFIDKASLVITEEVD